MQEKWLNRYARYEQQKSEWATMLRYAHIAYLLIETKYSMNLVRII
jgi:hypothetical protein